MKCDELEKYDAASNADLYAGYDHRYAYEADDVDEAIDELQAENAELKAELDEKDKDIAYWREEYDKETKLTDSLNAEIESLKASHYAEMVDAGMRERRLRRALWIARAWRAKERQRMLPNNKEFYTWQEVERRCSKKAEEYK